MPRDTSGNFQYGWLSVVDRHVSASGRTEGLVTLEVADVRAVADTDLIAVRHLNQSA